MGEQPSTSIPVMSVLSLRLCITNKLWQNNHSLVQLLHGFLSGKLTLPLSPRLDLHHLAKTHPCYHGDFYNFKIVFQPFNKKAKYGERGCTKSCHKCKWRWFVLWQEQAGKLITWSHFGRNHPNSQWCYSGWLVYSFFFVLFFEHWSGLC